MHRAKRNMASFRKCIAVVALAFVLLPGLASAQMTTAELQAQIQALLAMIQKLQAELAQFGGTQNVPQWCHTFDTNLRIGASGDDVAHLALALEKEGFDVGKTDLYDEVIASAVTGFQEKYRSEVLTPAGLKNGTGYVGARTRAKLNALYGCGKARVGVLSPKVPFFERPEELRRERVPARVETYVPPPQESPVTPQQTLSPEIVFEESPNLSVFETPPLVEQKVTCFFEGSESQQLCSTVNKDGKKFVFYSSGNTTAAGAVYGYMGETLLWQSSCGGSAYSMIGRPGEVNFHCYATRPTPTLTLLTPNGGEVWKAGGDYLVSWINNALYKQVGAHLRRKGGGPTLTNGQDAIALGTFYTDSFMLSMPTEIVPADDYLIEIINFDSKPESTWARDMSDAPFTVVNLSPTYPGVAYPVETSLSKEEPQEKLSGNQQPLITAVLGPSVLAAGESGNWTLTAYDPEGTCVSYSVQKWGDGSGGQSFLSPIGGPCLESVTFTHTFTAVGGYVIEFSVTDTTGNTAYASMEVVVK